MRYSGKQGLPLRAIFFNLLPAIAWGVLTVFFLFYVFRYVDLRPRVDENFFFSSNDPQAQTDKLISKIFLQTPELILSAKGDIRSPDYLRKVRELGSELAAIPGIDSVQSLTRGPRNTVDALESPLWKRVLLSEDQKATFIYVFLKERTSVEDAVLKIEKSKERFDSPVFQLMISGAPYIVELIQRNLLQDMKVFTVAAFCVFGLAGLLISRSVAMVLGTLVACINAGALASFIPVNWLLKLLESPILGKVAKYSIGIGVDAMIHVLIWVRRHPAGSMLSREAWAGVCSRLWKPILYSMSVVSAGFGIFILSGFPPTQRFGVSVVLGTLLSPLPALLLLPWFATARPPEEVMGIIKRRKRSAAP